MKKKSAFLKKILHKRSFSFPSEVKNSMENLTFRNEVIESIFNLMDEGIIAFDSKEGNVLFCNDASRRMFGDDNLSSGKKKVWEFFPLFEREFFLGDALKITRNIEILEPKYLFLNVSVEKIGKIGDDEKVEAKVLVIKDISQTLKESEEKLQTDHISTLSMLAAGIAHEIGNPLNSIMIHFQLMERRLKNYYKDAYQDTKKMLDISQSELSRLDRIIREFLKAVRPTKPTFEVIDINSVLKEAISLYLPEFEKNKIELKKFLLLEKIQIPVDSLQIKQVFYNIISNAIEAMEGGGEFRISTKKEKSFFVTTFNDSGTGIEKKNQNLIFEPYFTTKANGTGLGLVIVKRIIREHGGQIEIKNNRGRGLSVSIYLPLERQKMRLLPQ